MAGPDRTPWPALLAYGLPALPLALLRGPVLAAIPAFYVATLGLNQAAVGFVLLLARIWDGLSDPAIGMLSDRFSGRRSRRWPWMLAGLPLIALGGFAVFIPGASPSLWVLGLGSVLLFTGWTMVKLNHDAWGAEMSRDYDERTRITTVREALGVAGGLFAVILIAIGLNPDGPGLSLSMAALYGALALLLPLSLAVLAWRAQEPAPSPSAPLTLSGIQSVLAEPAARKLAVAVMLNSLAAALPATLFPPFVAFVIGRPDLTGPFILLYFICAILAAPLWRRVGERLGKDRAWMLAILIASAAFLPALFFRTGTEIWFALVCVITGVCFAADLALPPAMQADVADAIEAKTGARRSGLLFALLGLLDKLAYALAVGIAFPLLELAGFSQSPGAANTHEALWALAGLYAGLPVLLKLAALAALRGYPLSRAAHLELAARPGA